MVPCLPAWIPLDLTSTAWPASPAAGGTITAITTIIGCGTGEFSRRLAGRCAQVLGLDLSPGMVRVAQERSDGKANLTFGVADALTCGLPAGG